MHNEGGLDTAGSEPGMSPVAICRQVPLFSYLWPEWLISGSRLSGGCSFLFDGEEPALSPTTGEITLLWTRGIV
jgi:hypothetical protein